MSPSALKKEIKDFSPLFTRALLIVTVVYVSCWFFTIHIHALQQAQRITPMLPVIDEDSLEYAALSESLLQGRGFSQAGQLETLRTPGYPAFMIFIETIWKSHFAVTLVQILIVLISAVLIRRIGIVFASRSSGEAAAILFLLTPATLALTLLIYSDILFLCLFVTGFYVALQLKEEGLLRQVLVVLLLFACAIYVRPIGLLAVPIFVAPIAVSRLRNTSKVRVATVLLVGIFISLAPWMARNYAHTGVFSYTSIQASSILWATARFLADADHLPLDTAYKTLEDMAGTPESTWRDIRLSEKLNAVAKEVILERPVAYTTWHMTSSLSFLFPSTLSFMFDTYNTSLNQAPPFRQGAIRALTAGNFKAFYDGVSQTWWKLLERFAWLVVCGVAIITVWHRRNDPLAWALAFVIGYFMLLAGPAAGPRYSLQAWPFLFILFSAGCERIFQEGRYLRALK